MLRNIFFHEKQGPNGALQYLLAALEASDLKPNHSKFQAITTDR